MTASFYRLTKITICSIAPQPSPIGRRRRRVLTATMPALSWWFVRPGGAKCQTRN